MTARKLLKNTLLSLAIGGSLSAAAALAPAQAEVAELKIGYMKHPIQDASVEIMDKWAKEKGIELVKIPMAYSIFMEKVTATLTSEGDQFDIIWHNDDWGQLWLKWLETTDDIAGKRSGRGQ